MNDRKDWLEWRRSGIGASDAAIVAGRSPWGSRLELWLDKKGRLPERPASEAMELGLLLEPAIAAMYERKTGITLVHEQVRVEYRHYPFIRATLDRTTASGEIVELKAAGLWSGRELGEDGDSESLPEHWVLQAQHQMIAAERGRVTFAVLLPSLQVRIYPVERNEALCQALFSLEREFWRHVEADVPPEDLAPQDAATLSSICQFWEGTTILGDRESAAATDYIELGREINALQKRRDEAKARLLLSMNGFSLGVLDDGREVHVKKSTVPEKTVKAYEMTRLTIKECKA